MPRGRPKKISTLAGQLEGLTKQLTALTERVREAEGVKNAVDAVYRSSNGVSSGRPVRTRRRRRRTPAEMAAARAAAASAPPKRRRRRARKPTA